MTTNNTAPAWRRAFLRELARTGSVARAAEKCEIDRSSAYQLRKRNPVSVICRLAVSKDHARRGPESDLLADALRRIALASQSIRIGAVLVQAKDDNAKRFYLTCPEFIEFPADSRTPFLPIDTVIAGFG